MKKSETKEALETLLCMDKVERDQIIDQLSAEERKELFVALLSAAPFVYETIKQFF